MKMKEWMMKVVRDKVTMKQALVMQQWMMERMMVITRMERWYLTCCRAIWEMLFVTVPERIRSYLPGNIN